MNRNRTKTLIYGFIALVACPGALLSTAQGADETPRATIDRWERMWNTYDLNEVSELFCNCDDVSYFSSEKEGLIRGIDALVEHHRGFGFEPGESDRETKLWLDEIELFEFGESSLVTAIWYFERPERTQKGPVTILLKRNAGGKYEIVHMNFSNY